MCGAAPSGGAGLDGAEAIDAVGVGGGAAPAEEVGIVEAALGVGLPDLEHHVVERLAVELRDAAGDLDRLALRRLAARSFAPCANSRGKNGPSVISPVGISGFMAATAAASRPRTTSWYS